MAVEDRLTAFLKNRINGDVKYDHVPEMKNFRGPTWSAHVEFFKSKQLDGNYWSEQWLDISRDGQGASIATCAEMLVSGWAFFRFLSAGRTPEGWGPSGMYRTYASELLVLPFNGERTIAGSRVRTGMVGRIMKHMVATYLNTIHEGLNLARFRTLLTQMDHLNVQAAIDRLHTSKTANQKWSKSKSTRATPHARGDGQQSRNGVSPATKKRTGGTTTTEASTTLKNRTAIASIILALIALFLLPSGYPTGIGLLAAATLMGVSIPDMNVIGTTEGLRLAARRGLWLCIFLIFSGATCTMQKCENDGNRNAIPIPCGSQNVHGQQGPCS